MNRYEFNRFRNKLRRCKQEVLTMKSQIETMDVDLIQIRKRTTILANQMVDVTSQLTMCQMKKVLKFDLQ